MKIKVGINGFGRIGRTLARIIAQRDDLELVAVNDIADGETLAHLLKYDSVHGRYPENVTYREGFLKIGQDSFIALTHEMEPQNIDWQKHGVQIVYEATGKFKTHELAMAHFRGSVKKVIVTAPPADNRLQTVVLGVNDHELDFSVPVISNASCTTNCAAPLLKILDDHFVIEQAYVTTVHSYTTDQRLHDAPHKDLRRARAAALNMIPTSTGAAKALTHVFPHLQGKIGGCGIRVPVPNGSLSDITCMVKKDTTLDEVNRLFEDFSRGKMRGILDITNEPLVSMDIVGMTHSCLVDSLLTSVLGKMIKVVGWYDNEYGYSSRLADLAPRFLAG